MTGQAYSYQWFKQRLILSVSEPSISWWSQIKEDTVEPCVPAREFNLKAYAVAITWHNDPACWASNPDSPITVARQRLPRRYQQLEQRHRGRHFLWIHCVLKKKATWCLIITLAKYGPIFKILSPIDSRDTYLCINTRTSTSPAICCYTTLWKSKIRKCYRIFTLNLTVNMFN